MTEHLNVLNGLKIFNTFSLLAATRLRCSAGGLISLVFSKNLNVVEPQVSSHSFMAHAFEKKRSTLIRYSLRTATFHPLALYSETGMRSGFLLFTQIIPGTCINAPTLPSPFMARGWLRLPSTAAVASYKTCKALVFI